MSFINVLGGDTNVASFNKTEEAKGPGDDSGGQQKGNGKEMLKQLGELFGKLQELMEAAGGKGDKGDKGDAGDKGDCKPSEPAAEFLKATGKFLEASGNLLKSG